MKGIVGKTAGALVAAVLVLTVGTASAQGLWYKEVEKDGRVYVFNTLKKYEAWQKSGDMGVAITLVGHGPKGETVVAENETAIDLFNLKHDRPGYDREAPKPAAPPPNPTRLKIGNNGELWFGGLFQGWFVADTSPAGSGTDWLGNNTGQNTFRLRRAEIRMSGRWKDLGFTVMLDPAKSINTSSSAADGKILQDLAVSFFGLKGQEFSLGQLKIDITEEGMRSSSELWFGERSQITRAISDVRQTGFFYKGDFGDMVTIWSAVTNGTLSNTISDTNDTLLYSGRGDVRPMKGLVVGTSGGIGETQGGVAHRKIWRWGGHAKYGGYDVPDSKLWAEIEYYAAGDQQADGSMLERWGWYGSVLYMIGNFQAGFRYDRINNNRNVPLNNQTQYTVGLHWLPLGKNVNFKLDWLNINQDGRKVNGVARCCYNEFLLAAQAAF
ncbi:MAG TPA: porin [Thermoanaerobaculia bacterium]|nr:porin [Thermoanaerobaculia bacterium]HQR66691.1 porin [Thermoanaerobaculia bacterium]